MAALAGRKEMMDRFVDPSAARRVLLAGTYNAHPVPTAAAVATIERLRMNDGEVYRHTEELGSRMERGMEELFAEKGIEAVIARQGSAFCWYFMDHCPQDWHDLALHHDFELDAAFRANLVDRGIFVFPLPPKQNSISAAHTAGDIDLTLQQLDEALTAALDSRSRPVRSVGIAG